MEETDLQALERFVAENDDLLALEERIGRFNIFDALGIARIEIRHSNYLAWLLAPGESHGQGELFLKSFLMDVLRRAREQGMAPPVSPVQLDGADLQGVEIRREWRNIDILITCEEPRFVIAIENKVDSGERTGQLQKYEDIVAASFPGVRSLFVFLTPEGDDASDEDWVTYSYAQLYQVLCRTRRANKGSIGGDVAVFLEHYLSLIGDRFMENEDIDKLCRQIYSNHRRALELIWERVGPSTSELIDRIQQWIKTMSSDWILLKTTGDRVEFMPKVWEGLLPRVSAPGPFAPDRWLFLSVRVKNNRLRLVALVAKTTDAEARNLLLDLVLRTDAGFGFSTPRKKKRGDKWTRVLSEDICTLPEDEEPDIDAVMEKVEKRLAEFLKQTAGLPAAVKELFPSAAL